MRKFMCFAIAAVTCVTLFACSKKEYNTDYSCKELCRTATGSLEDGQEYIELGEEHLKYEFGDDARGAEDYCILVSVKVEDINEIGIFLAADEKVAKEIAEDCREYLEELDEGKRAFIASYAPNELPKLDESGVRIYGRYVVYTVLDNDSATKAFEKIESMIEK